MGMFDYYYPNPPLRCPICGEELREWQGKDGPCALLRFEQGGDAPPAADGFGLYTSDTGRHWIEAEGRVHQGRWIETVILNARPLDQPAALPSPFFDERAGGAAVDTLIIHSMYNPEGEDRFSAAACKACLDGCEVSAHYLIDREGLVWRCVPEEKRAWHAGESLIPDAADGRPGVNHFSIGIELIGAEDCGFTERQYGALAELAAGICERHPIRQIYGHADIAPQRKQDPWNFDWPRFAGDLKRRGGRAAAAAIRPGL